MAIRISKTYRTVSHDVAIILAQIQPILSKINMVSDVYNVKLNKTYTIKNSTYKIDLPTTTKTAPFHITLPHTEPFASEDFAIYTDGFKHNN